MFISKSWLAGIAVVLSIVIVIAAWATWHFAAASTVSADQKDSEESTHKPVSVTLTQAKFNSAAIQTGMVQSLTWQPTMTIHGRLDYDEDLHVAVKSSIDGILSKILVRPGDQVASGQVLAVISSPQVGKIRATIKQRDAQVRLAEITANRSSSIRNNLELLIQKIRAGIEPDKITNQLDHDSLGSYQQALMDAYTRLRLANSSLENIKQAVQRGAIAGVVQEQRQSEQQAAQASLESVIDQSKFDVRQDDQQKSAELENALRMRQISEQELKSLVGPEGMRENFESDRSSDADLLSQVNVVSPLTGTIEQRMFATLERVHSGDAMFIVADTKHLWATGNILQRDWSAIQIEEGRAVSIHVPAIKDSKYEAKVAIVGRSIDPVTGSAPLIAAIHTDDMRLRPGLFIYMTLPIGETRDVVAVPEQAVVTHERQAFVFVPSEQLSYRRVDVQAGASINGQLEIIDGLEVGDTVVTAGAFKLKSELLLSQEAPE